MVKVLKGIMIIIGILTLGILVLPCLIVLSFVEAYAESDEYKEKRTDKQSRSRGKGIFIRY